MENPDQTQRLKQVRLIFWLNFIVAFLAFVVFTKALESGILWKLICSGIAFAIFLGITILLYMMMKRLQKDRKNLNQ